MVRNIPRSARVLTAALAVAVLASAANGSGVSGGDSIATAVELPLNTRVAVDHRNIGPDFWRLGLNRGDRLTIEFKGDVDLCLLAPGTRDPVWRANVCAAGTGTSITSTLGYTATAAGAWVLVVYSKFSGYECHVKNNQSLPPFDCVDNKGTSYSLTASVAHGPAAPPAIPVPTAQVRGRTITVVGCMRSGRVYSPMGCASTLGGKVQTVGKLTITSIRRVSRVRVQLGEARGDLLRVSGYFDNTTRNSPVTSIETLSFGFSPGPCRRSGLLCKPPMYSFRKQWPIHKVGGLSEGRNYTALAGERVSYDVYIDLNPGSIRRNPAIRSLAQFWLIPYATEANEFGGADLFYQRSLVRLSRVWRSTQIPSG